MYTYYVAFCMQIWSSGSGQTHSPPNDLVMKSSKWIPNKEVMVCVLVNSDGEVRTIAICIISSTSNTKIKIAGSPSSCTGRLHVESKIDNYMYIVQAITCDYCCMALT